MNIFTKTPLTVAAILAAFSIHAAPGDGSDIARNAARELQKQHALYEQQAMENAAKAEYNAEIQAELVKIYSKDPWRQIGNTTNLARGPGWVEFQGEVQSIVNNGVIMKGKYGQVLTVWTDPDYSEHLVQSIKTESDKREHRSETVSDTSFQQHKIYGDDLFFVEGFPYPGRTGTGYEELMALDSDYYTYTNTLDQALTIHKLIYGKPCSKIWTPEELAEAKLKAGAKKQAVLDKVLKSNQESAGRGEPYGLMRMGERYRDGEGVEKDLAQARAYLQRAADAGSVTAGDELSKLSPQ